MIFLIGFQWKKDWICCGMSSIFPFGPQNLTGTGGIPWTLVIILIMQRLSTISTDLCTVTRYRKRAFFTPQLTLIFSIFFRASMVFLAGPWTLLMKTTSQTKLERLTSTCTINSGDQVKLLPQQLIQLQLHFVDFMETMKLSSKETVTFLDNLISILTKT